MSWRLLFSGTQSVAWTISVVLGVILAFVLCYWLLRIERRLVSRATGLTLLMLRLTVMLVLLLTLLKPVLTRSWDAEQAGRVVVAVDVSQSMETKDQHASVAEKLRWAQSLGMLGNEASTPIINEWITDLEAGKEPNWLGRPASSDIEADRELAVARRKQLTDVLNEFSRLRRTEFMHRLLTSQPGHLLEEISDVVPVDLRLYATQQEAIAEKQLRELLESPRTELVPSGTDPAEFLTQVLSESDGSPVRGIVMFTDGRSTVPGDVAAEARRLGALGVPVYTVPIGSRFAPRDLSIFAVENPETVFVNDSAQILATIGTSGFEGQELAVRLEQDGRVVETQSVTPAGESAQVRFSVPTTEAGRKNYQIVTDTFPGELRDDNNRRDVSISVVDTKARVLLVEGDARWEFRYLKNLLERDQQIELKTILFRQPYVNLLNDTFISRQLPLGEELRSELGSTDLLVIGDAGPVDLPDAFWQVVEEAVAREGLTVVVIPGRRHMPADFESAVLNVLLPVEQSRQRMAEQLNPTVAEAPQSAFKLRPTPDGSQLPMFQLGAEQPGQVPEFKSLPGHPWAYTATPRPSATVWADVVLSEQGDASEAAIVHHFYGFGQVLWMGIDSTWRWRQRAGDSWHYRYWGQLVRWAARNKAAAGNDQVRLTLSDVLIDDTETVEVVARWNSQLIPQLSEANVTVVVSQIDSDMAAEGGAVEGGAAGDSQVVRLEASPGTPERFTARLPRLPAGNWKVELKTEGGTIRLREEIASELLVRSRVSAELADVSCNRDLLKQISDLSGGQMLEPHEIERLPELLEPPDQSGAQIEERSLWDHWGLLPVFFLLLMTEWIVRKLNGLP